MMPAAVSVPGDQTVRHERFNAAPMDDDRRARGWIDADVGPLAVATHRCGFNRASGGQRSLSVFAAFVGRARARTHPSRHCRFQSVAKLRGPPPDATRLIERPKQFQHAVAPKLKLPCPWTALATALMMRAACRTASMDAVIGGNDDVRVQAVAGFREDVRDEID
jgi:hypothetical protein